MAEKTKKLPTSAFTLAELLIVVALIAILAGVVIFSNIRTSIERARDSKRKQDLNKLARTLEDYYNDHGGYPQNVPSEGTFADADWGEPFEPYLPLLPKDPLSPKQDYYYQTDPVRQNFFAFYAKLEYNQDDDIERVGCGEGCGPNKEYSFVVTSPNIIMLAGLPNGIDPLEGVGDGGDGNGDGNGGTGEPSPTGGPSPTLGPSPTPPLTPTPTSPPCTDCTNPCSFDTCGFCQMCGGDTGHDCGYLTRCWYDSIDWVCKFDVSCIF